MPIIRLMCENAQHIPASALWYTLTVKRTINWHNQISSMKSDKKNWQKRKSRKKKSNASWMKKPSLLKMFQNRSMMAARHHNQRSAVANIPC